MAEQTTSVLTTIKEYFLISLGLTLYAVAWSLFLLPNNLVSGGASGIAAIIYYATKFPIGYSYLIINAILLLIAYKVIGLGFCGKTIWAIVFLSILLTVMPGSIPTEFINEFSLENGKLLCVLIGGAIMGIGIGMSISQGGSTGGTDIIALILTKFLNVPTGKALLWIDIIILSSVIFIPAQLADGTWMTLAGRVATAIYGMVLVTVSGNMVDLYLAGGKKSAQVFIFSEKYREIATSIVYDLKRGATVIPAIGWYTKMPRNVVMVIVRKSDINLLFKCIKQIDPGAFLSVSNVNGVFGQGFDMMKEDNHDKAKEQMIEFGHKIEAQIQHRKAEKMKKKENN